VRFKKHDVIYEVRDAAHAAAFRAAGWQELTETEQRKAEGTISEPAKADVENSVETVKNAKPKRAKA
jgi:hypothetical protein